MTPQRLDIEYFIDWKGRWHTGSGYGSIVADRMQKRDSNGSPIVPGSHIKGVLRHQVERIASSLGLDVVDPHAGSKSGDRQLTQHFGPLRTSCLLVDRLFGTRYQGGCLFVTNATPETLPSDDEISLVTRTAIDRVTGTVKERHLFTAEVVEHGSPYVGTIRARHPKGVLTQEGNSEFPLEYSLLVAALLSIDVLGGAKSAGYGRCEVSLKDEALRWNEESLSADDARRSLKDKDWADLLEIVREDMTL